MLQAHFSSDDESVVVKLRGGTCAKKERVNDFVFVLFGPHGDVIGAQVFKRPAAPGRELVTRECD